MASSPLSARPSFLSLLQSHAHSFAHWNDLCEKGYDCSKIMDTTQPDSVSRDFHHRDDHADMVNGKGQYLDEHDPDSALRQIKTSGTGTVTISSDLFEKLYLQPKTEALGLKHPLQKLWGNPTGLAIIGFEMSLMPITMQLMEWRGAGGNGASENAQCIFYGGVLMWISGFMEFFLGNTFPFIVFMTFGSFYCAFGTGNMPQFASFAAFSKDPVGNPWAGLQSPEYAASAGFYWVAFTVCVFFFWICTLRTNLVYIALFSCIVPGIGCIAGVYMNLALGRVHKAHDCQVAAGAILFACVCIGWYLFGALIFPSVDFPIPLPLGDVSTIVPGLSTLSAGKGPRRSLFRREKRDSVDDAV